MRPKPLPVDISRKEHGMGGGIVVNVTMVPIVSGKIRVRHVNTADAAHALQRISKRESAHFRVYLPVHRLAITNMKKPLLASQCIAWNVSIH
jgi:hypothetical protein